MKRLISFLLALAICVSCVPAQSLQVWAEEAEATEPTAVPAETEVSTEPTGAPTMPPIEETVPPEKDGGDSAPLEPQLISVDWVGPYKYEYIINREYLDTTGCTVTFTYDDGHQEVYDIYPKHVTGFDNTVLGKQKLVATYNGFEFRFTVTIIEEPKPRSMFFRAWEVKNAYFLGEDLDLTGGTLQVYYSDGSVMMVPVEDPGVTVSGYDPNLLGEQFLTISYQGLTTEFRVTVCSYTGTCGDNLDYVFDEATGTLTITGSGAMYDYDYNGAPWAAYADQIRTVELPVALTALGMNAFWCCYNLNSINLPDGITSIPDHALEECRALTSLEIPDSVTHIGHYAFSGAGLTSLDLPEGLESIGNYAFMSCGSLREIVLPESLKSLGGGAFQFCTGLETANLPESIDTVSWHTFIECTSLQEIVIPKTVTEISYYAFTGCTSLGTVIFEGSAPSVDAGLFGDCYPFDNVTSDAWYPDGDITWTQTAMQSMGGDLTWRALPASASILTLHDELNGKAFTMAVADGDTITDAPALREVAGYEFIGWYSGRDGTGDQLIPGSTVWQNGMPKDYYAYYQKTAAEEQYKLSVYARYYVNGVQENTVLLLTQNFAAGEKMYRWLSDNAANVQNAICEYSGSDAYQWNGQYYDYFTDEIVTGQDLIADGNRCVYVKAVANKDTEARVLLYVYKGTGTAVSGIYAMPGYTVGDVVYMADVRDVIEANYGSIYPEIQGLYTNDTWADLQNGMSVDGVNSVTVDDDVIKIHVILKQAPKSGSCGDNLTWNFDDATGTLTISGTGEMWDLEVENTPWAAYTDAIVKLVVDKGVLSIGQEAFWGCGELVSVSLPEGLQSIGNSSFLACRSLPGITLPETLTTIEDQAFFQCAELESIYIPASVSYIGVIPFGICGSLTGITVDPSNQYYSSDKRGFLFNKDKTVLHQALTNVNGSYTVPDGVTEIGGYAFDNCQLLKEVVIPDSVTKIETHAFTCCYALKEIRLSSAITEIGYNAFLRCWALERVTIPANVRHLDKRAFAECKSLSEVVFEGRAPLMKDLIFEDVTATAYYPANDPTWTADVMQSYGGNITWVPYEGIIPEDPTEPTTPVDPTGPTGPEEPTEPEEVICGVCGDNLTWTFGMTTGTLTISGSGAMYDYDWDGAPWKPYAEEILRVELPDTLTALGAYAFDGCVNLKKLNLPEGIPAIPKYALNRCKSLTSLTIPKSVKVIGDTAFSECDSLTSLVLPDSVETVENFAFIWNSGLKKIVLPKSLKNLSCGAFDNCSALESVNIPASLGMINWSTFSGCTSLKEITIPGSVTEIAYGAFGGSGLEKVTFEGSAPYVADHVFKPFDGVTADAWYPGGDATWTQTAMDSMGGNLTWKEIGGSVDPVYPVTATVKSKVNIRKEPTIYAVKIGELAAGTKVTIYEIKTVDSLEWARIDQGWVVMQYLEIPASGEVTSGTCGDNLTWTVDKDAGTLTISGTGDMYDYNVDTSPWYHLRDAIKHLIFEPGVTGIGDYAFFACGNLETVSLMPNVSRIGDGAFGLCRNLQEITLPDGLTTIGYGVFEECNSLTSIRIPEKVTVLEDQTFSACFALRNIELPQTLTRIGWETFHQCESLESIILPFGLTEIPEQAFVGCTSLTSITIPDSVTDIGAYAFEFCSSLSSIKVGKNVANIHRYAFRAGDTLNEIVFTGNAPVSDKEFLEHITAIAYYPANNPTWTSDVMQDYGGNITWVPYGGAATSGVCGDNLTWTFDKDTGTLTISGSGAMYDYAPGKDNAAPWYHLQKDIKNLVLSDDITTIGDCAFWGGAGIRTVHIPEGVVSIGNFAFDICEDLAEITLPETLTHIGEYAFNYTGLKNITIPSGITVIEYGTFYLCQSLEEVIFCGDAPEFKWHNQNGNEENVFSGVTATVYYPASNPTWIPPVMQDYGGNITWRPYGEAATSGVCGDNLTWTFDKDTGTLTISGYGAMYDFSWETRPWNTFKEQILTVELPEELTSLGEYAFGGCHNLTSINLPDGITSIPDYAFGECSALSGLVIPDSVKHIGEYALDGCRSLTSLVIPDSVETVEFGAFYGCNGLKEIVLPDSIKELGACAFKYCSALETIKLSESLQIIHYNTFWECTSLKEIDIPESVTEIGYHSFADCTALETITFAGSAPQPAYGNDDPHFAPFRDLTADAWYPAEDPTWTDETMQRLGRDLNWIPVGTPKNCIIVDSADLGDAATAWVDGMEYPISYRSGSGYIFLPGRTSKTMVVHTYHVDDPNDVHTQYPVSMKVWTLENTDGVYTATRQLDFENILQYSGMSIRTYGKKGIRMITSMEQSKKNALTSGGLNGYTLKEYGTAIAWADQLSDSRPLVLGKSYVKSNFAYKRGIADPVFQYTGSLMQYTNVLVNFSNEQCKDDIAMRPYMILQDAEGNSIIIYGGIVTRSIGYIAYQNRNVFEPGTEEYEYIWDIIHYVYGNIYDDEYKKVWTPPAM